MKKLICIILAAVLITGSLAACGQGTESGSKTEDKLQIVTSIFPAYDWTRNILGESADHAELTMLMDSGVDLHSYQPSVEDIQKIASCDVLVYVGGESDEWIEDALEEATNDDMVVIKLMDLLGDRVKDEEVVEGMEAEEEEDENEDEAEADEHVWLSLTNAKIAVQQISEQLQDLNSENAADYKKNTTAYIKQIDELDARFRDTLSKAKKDTILVGDRFPFRYLADDYDLDYYAAFVGCSAETEASFETIRFLAEKLDELDLHTVLILENSKRDLAETIIKNTKTQDQKIQVMDSMQSITAGDVENGDTYLSIMEQNLSVLNDALR